MVRFVIFVLGLIIAAGCERMRTSTGTSGDALRLIEQSESSPALLSGELNNTVCDPWFIVGNESDVEISVCVATKSCSCVGLFVDEKSLRVGDGFTLASGQRKRVRLEARVSSAPTIQRFGATLSASDGSSIALEGSQTVYIDTECVPSLLTPPMQREVGDVEQVIEVVHSFRSETPRSPRPKAMPPGGVTVLSMSPQHEPKELLPGIWKNTWHVRLKLRPADIADASNLRFTIKDGRLRPVKIAVPIKVTQAFGIAAPENVAFGAVGLGDQRSRRLVMHSLDHVAFKVIRANTDSPEINVSVKESGDQSRYWIEVGFQPDAVGDRRATISIETTHPDSPRLTIAAVGRGRIMRGNNDAGSSGG